jgi:TonB family protein
MKYFAAALVLLMLVFSSDKSTTAQQAWTDVTPKGEHFSVLMPGAPTTISQKYLVGQFNVEGRAYGVTSNGIEYTVWSLKNPHYADYKSIEGESYVDGCADLAWDGLLKPWRDSLPKSVQGKVLIQTVFAKSGEVTNIRVLKGLPHGLTQKAIEVVRQIKFVPATKDGHQVSQYIILEIDFKLY